MLKEVFQEACCCCGGVPWILILGGYPAPEIASGIYRSASAAADTFSSSLLGLGATSSTSHCRHFTTLCCSLLPCKDPWLSWCARKAILAGRCGGSAGKRGGSRPGFQRDQV